MTPARPALTKLQREIGGGAIGSRPVLAKLMREIGAYGTHRYGDMAPRISRIAAGD